jgi:hypothetical protein
MLKANIGPHRGAAHTRLICPKGTNHVGAREDVGLLEEINLLFVTTALVTFFLIASKRGDFYLFFIRWGLFFVTILCHLSKMQSSVHRTAMLVQRTATLVRRTAMLVHTAARRDGVLRL